MLLTVSSLLSVQYYSVIQINYNSKIFLLHLKHANPHITVLWQFSSTFTIPCLMVHFIIPLLPTDNKRLPEIFTAVLLITNNMNVQHVLQTRSWSICSALFLYASLPKIFTYVLYHRNKLS